MKRHLLLMSLLLLAISGCVRLEREAPIRDYFGLEVHRTAEPSESPLFGAVRIYRFDPAARFGGDRFVYRQEELRYVDDYYNRFIAPPGVLIAEETRRWLDDSGLFQDVLSGPARVEPPYLMEGRVVELHGDFRREPSAILALEITFVHDARGRSETLLRRTYRAAHPLEDPSGGALALGWSRALEEILRSLEEDLRSVARGQ